ncbi:MAG: T9SS type A sorting domain-containing protein [Bacteroidales bacterium]|nr:T9SS type A sorting domain-containing protein [Bacteroidales bacterium]
MKTTRTTMTTLPSSATDNSSSTAKASSRSSMLLAANCSARNSQLSTPTAPGVYVLRLINGDDVKTQKIVIQ